jgi:tetratricopeptide (TPR) repeat protein
VLTQLLAADPLDHWARYESGDVEGFFAACRNDAQTVLDVAYDYADAGCVEEAAALLEAHHDRAVPAGAVPNPLRHSQLTHYALAWLRRDADLLAKARTLSPDYCFPSRLQDQLVLQWALEQPGADRNAAYGLGNYYYDRKRHEDAIAAWEAARDADRSFATVHRNLGIAYWNIRRDGESARDAYQSAQACDPADARLFAEFDQLRAKLGDASQARLETLLSRLELVAERDDCSVSLAELYNQTDQPEQALQWLLGRRFHPWEGGEGKVLRQYTTARLSMGRQALADGRASEALEHFELAMQPPPNLGEAYHLLQAKADVSYWMGKALREMGREDEARAQFQEAADESGDFQSMAVTAFSELTYYKALALRELGHTDQARAVAEAMKAFAEAELQKPAAIDYFATSLPNLLVLEEDLDEVKRASMQRLIELATSLASFEK